MSVLNQDQSAAVVVVSFPNTTLTAFDIPRPQTLPQESAYAEGTDHITRPSFLKEHEGGRAVVDLASTLALSTVFLSKLTIKSLLPTAQKGLQDASTAFFPSGAPTDATVVRDLFVDSTNSLLAVSSDAFKDLMGLARTNMTVPSLPGITLREGEFIHMELYNNSGGALNNQAISAVYKMGLNNSDVGKR